MARVLFLGGLGRSGTTLVERLLGELPGVCAARRDRPPVAARHPRRRALRLRRPVLRLHVLAARSAQRAFGGWHDVDVAPGARAARRGRAHPAHPAAGHRGRAPTPRSASTPTTTPGSTARPPRSPAPQVVVDSSKHSALAHVLRWADDIDLRVVHVVRDARGVAYSWTKTVTRPETDGTDEMTRYSPGRSALLWNAHNAAFGLLARRGVAGAPDPLRGVPRRPAGRRCASSPRSPGSTLADADLDFLGDGHADLERRAQRGRQPDAVHRRPAAAAPRRRLAARAAAAASAGWSARSARRCCARTATRSTPSEQEASMNWPSVGVVIPTREPSRAGPQGHRRGPRQDYPGEMQGRRGLRPDRAGLPARLAPTARQVLVLTNWRTSGPGRRPQHRHPGAGHRARGVLRRRRRVARRTSCAARSPRCWPSRTRSSPPARSRWSTRAGSPRGWPARSRVTIDELARSRMAMLHSSSFLVRREALRRRTAIGLVAEDAPGSQNEDWDLLLRAARRAPIVHVDEPLVRVLWGRSSHYAYEYATKISSLRWMMQRHPEISGCRPGAARVYGQLACWSAATGNRSAGVAVQQGGGTGQLAGAADRDRSGRDDRRGQGGERALRAAQARPRHLAHAASDVTLLRTPDPPR